jgi:hypothetical protein
VPAGRRKDAADQIAPQPRRAGVAKLGAIAPHIQDALAGRAPGEEAAESLDVGELGHRQQQHGPDPPDAPHRRGQEGGERRIVTA